jgi:ketosteroid isomerase-like protein
MAKALIPLIIACTLACSPRANCPPAELHTAEGAEKALNDYYAAVSRDGLMAEFAYLDSSEAFFWVPPGYTAAIGFDSVASAIRRNANQWRHIEIGFDTVAVHLTGPQTATYSGRLHAEMTDTAGNVTDIHLVETGTLIRRADGWKLLCGQTSLIPR